LDPIHKIIVISRADRGARKLTNHVQLMAALKAKFPAAEVVEFVGTKQSVAAAKDLFMHSKLVIGPHGGAWLNIAFASPGELTD
jgi:hypothetical protein